MQMKERIFFSLDLPFRSPNMDRIYGYSLCYQKLVVSVALVLHLAAAFLSVFTIYYRDNIDEDFFDAMKKYSTNPTSKAVVDNVQYALQCCGVHSYKDWFETDWKKRPGSNLQKR